MLLELQEKKETLVHKDQQEKQVHVVKLVLQVPMEILVYKAHQDLQENKVTKEDLDIQVHLVPQDKEVRMV